MPSPGQDSDASRRRTRTKIVEAAARLLRSDGPEAVTTRAVAAKAGVQAPTLYRLFGDKDGLLDAVAEHVFATYVSGKTVKGDTADPVADLRAAWALHIEFGLANPALFSMLSDPLRRTHSTTAAAGMEVLLRRLQRVAAAGRLQVAEQRAVELIHAAGTGVILTLLSSPAKQRDLGLADVAYDALARTLFTQVAAAPRNSTTAAAVTLRRDLGNLSVLSGAEAALMAEWLERIIKR